MTTRPTISSPRCPHCQKQHAHVCEIRFNHDSIRRTYACPCGQSFFTREAVSTKDETESRHIARLVHDACKVLEALRGKVG